MPDVPQQEEPKKDTVQIKPDRGKGGARSKWSSKLVEGWPACLDYDSPVISIYSKKRTQN
jgi:hypothetical protein